MSLFADGHPVAALFALLMQATLVLWPVAARWAYVSNERMGVERLLAELSDTHQLSVDPYGNTAKKFRQLA
ncbi:hypothetical protein [Acidocella sp.]|uniref:hypothetical protein n=1 Tax=Acidocella sp. TaxID=50710 RepID=UPI0026067D33|nr:hypothetical protein [Acidocella sp.]